MRILIGADFVPTASNTEYFNNGDAEMLVGNRLIQILKSADYRIFNLETPLTDKTDEIDKWGPHLSAPKSAVAGYKAVGADLLTLANNHILDQNEQGLKSTVETLEKNGIRHLGTGKNLEEAARSFEFSVEGKNIGVYACAEHEFSIAGENKPGANPFDPLETPDRISELKKRCDYVIVLYHGGKELYRYPSPRLRKVCRKLVEKGADLVLCQHTHCVGCEEKYGNGTIVYGQGNFLFDYSDNECWNTGLLVGIGDDFEVTYIPLIKTETGIRLAEGSDGENIISGFSDRSKQILEEGFVEKSYKEYSTKKLNIYLNSFSGKHNCFFKAVNKLSKKLTGKSLIAKKYDKRIKIAIRNYIECEAHTELIITGLSE